MHFTIVGGGPAGIFSALLLASAGHTCRVLEGNAVIGGCHRVDRVGGVFSEHGPRVYGSNFLRYKRMLRFVGLRFEDHYVPYEYSFPVGLAGAASLMTVAELAALAASYARFMVQPGRYDRMSVAALLEGFSDGARAYFDKICKLTDGAGIGRYTAGELFSLVNQGLFYSFHEPRAPTDEFLWAACAERLRATGRAEVRTGAWARALRAPGGPGTRVTAVELDGGEEVPVPGALVLAVPPAAARRLLAAPGTAPHLRAALMPWDEFARYSAATDYLTYLPFTLRWDRRVELPRLWGNGFGDWGVIWVAMSDYFEGDHTLLSCSVVELDAPSETTGLTANGTRDRGAMVREAARQVLAALGPGPPPDAVVLSPAVYRTADGRRWATTDTAYVRTPESRRVPFRSPTVPGLFTLGCHNERHDLAFTSMEAVTQNALRFCEEVDPRSVAHGALRGYRGDRIYTLNSTIGHACVALGALAVAAATCAPPRGARTPLLVGGALLVFYGCLVTKPPSALSDES